MVDVLRSFRDKVLMLDVLMKVPACCERSMAQKKFKTQEKSRSLTMAPSGGARTQKINVE